MLSAIVLLTTERDKTNKVAEVIADLEGSQRGLFRRGPLRSRGDCSSDGQ
jgi:hypothetical protein